MVSIEQKWEDICEQMKNLYDDNILREYAKQIKPSIQNNAVILSVPNRFMHDWLRRKHNIVIYNKVEPFVDPTDDTHKKILFKYGVKRCDINHLGWNGRIDLGATRLSTNVYSLKREAINIAIKYIKSQKK
jgi:hypothetical protein